MKNNKKEPLVLMDEIKNYVALSSLPICGIKKGDILIVNKTTDVIQITNELEPDCVKQFTNPGFDFDNKEFFKQVKTPKYNVNDDVLFVKKGCKIYGTITKIKNNTYVVYTILSNDGSRFDAYECEINNKVHGYWFCDSKGKIRKSFEGRDADVDEWRRSIGNMFDTKEDVYEYKEKLVKFGNSLK